MAITNDGLVSGTITYAPPPPDPAFSESFSQFKMDPDKSMLAGTGTDSDGFNSLSVRIRGGGSFATVDLVGTWYFYSFWDAFAFNFNDPGWDRSTLTMDSSGTITGGSFTDSDGHLDSVTGGSISIDGNGFVGGTINYAGGFSDILAAFKMDPDKNLLAGVSNGADGYVSLSILLKGGGSFATSDLAGRWHLFRFRDNPAFNDPGWGRGTVSLDATGTVTGGSVADSTGASTSITGGSVSITSAGLLSGSITYASAPTDSFTDFKMNADKNVIVGVGTDSGGYRVLSVFVKAAAGIANDFDGDGKSDILWRNTGTGANFAWLMNGLAVDASGSIGAAGTAWEVAGLGDLNGDTKADILWRNPGTGANVVWLMNGLAVDASGSIGAAGAAWEVAGLGDLNGDGKADILWRNPSTGANFAWLMNGLAVDASGSIGAAGTAWEVAGLGDLNGDAKADILWRNPSTGANVAWLMNGLAVDTAGSIGAAGTVWQVAGLGDLNGDAKADVLWRNSSTGANVAWLMNGLALDGAGSIGGVPVAWQVAELGDFNGDTKADVLWRNPSTGANIMWLMNGLAVDSSGPIGSVGSNWQVQ